ncbi:MAG: hypothetical protein SFY70_07895 [Bacteroidia bacterium]|nr:hypothetical protein [Bacteroidia bacterium]
MAETPTERPLETTEARLADDTGGEKALLELGTRLDGTFQLEMLVSGTVLFLAFSLASYLSVQIEALFVGRAEGGRVLTVLLGLVNGLLYILVGNLLVHLLLRSYWVGVVGLATVFPSGARMDKLPGGPIYRAFSLRHKQSITAHMVSVDRACRLVYSLTFTLLATFVFGFVLFGGIAGLSYAVAQLNIGLGPLDLFWGAYLALLLPYYVVYLLDRYGERFTTTRELVRSPNFVRLARGLYTVLFGVLFIRNIQPVVTTLTSNLGQRRYALVLVCYLGLLYLGMFTPLLEIADRPYRADASRPEVSRSAHYENLRSDNETVRLPLLEADKIARSTGYLRVFLPYTTRFNDSLAAWYPNLRPLEATGLRLRTYQTDTDAIPEVHRALASCYQLQFADSLLHIPLRLYTHPTLGHDGLLGYLPVGALAPGEHTLIVQECAGDPPRRYPIAFWVY